MLRKTLSIILAIAMLCTLIPSVAFATDEESVIGEADSATDIVVTDDAETTEDLVVAPMKANNYDTSKLPDIGVPMPKIISNYSYSASDDAAQIATPEDLPQDSLTYLLIDSDSEAKSNFEAVLPSGSSWQKTASNMCNQWLDGVNTRRSDTSGEEAASTHTGYIVVPESVGAAGKEFQVVTMTIRTSDTGSARPPRYELNNRGAKVWIDDQPVAVDITQGHDVLGNMRTTYDYTDNGLANWRIPTINGGTFYIWEWGPTVTLTPGVHKVVFKPNGTTQGGRIPGLIITDALGYDWTKISPFPDDSNRFGSTATGASAYNMRKDFENSFGAAGYIDFEAPTIDGEITVEPGGLSAALSWNEAVDNADSAYADRVGYKIEYNDVVEYVVGTSAVIRGLDFNTDYSVSVTPIDGVGNEGNAISVGFKTLETVDYPYFSDVEVNVNISDSDSEEIRTTTLPISWNPAVYTGEGTVAYNLYLNGDIVAENVTETSYTFDELTPATAYDVKIVATVDGIESEEMESAINVSLTTQNVVMPDFSKVELSVEISPDTSEALRTTTLPVSWTAPVYEGSSVLTFNLYLDDALVVSGLSKDTLSYTFRDLTPNTEYTVKLTSVLDGVERTEEGTYITAQFTTDSVSAPTFATNVITSSVTANAGDSITTIPVTWAAASYSGDQQISYNVYVDGAMVASNVKSTSYTIEGISDTAKHTVRIVAVLAGVETSASIQADLYKAANKPAVESVDDVTENTVTLTVSRAFEPVDNFTVKYTVIVNGSAADFTTVGNNQIVINNLIDGIEQNILIQAVETDSTTGMTYTVTYPAVKATTLQGSTQATFAEDMPKPIMFDQEAITSGKYVWPVKADDTTQGSNAWMDPGQNWYTTVGAASATVEIPTSGQYYMITRAFNYSLADANRYFTATVGGKTVTNTDGQPFKFGLDNAAQRTWDITYSPVPLQLQAGEVKVQLTPDAGVLRVEFIAFIPAASESQLQSIIANMTSKEAFLNTFVPTTIFANNSVTAVPLGLDKILVTWTPTQVAQGMENVEYAVYLNDKLVDTVDANTRRYAINTGVLIGTNKIKVSALVGGVEDSSSEYTLVIKDTINVQATQVLNEENVLQGVSLALTNPSSTATKKLAVLVATYYDNRIVQKTYEVIEVLPGTSTVNYSITSPALLVKQTANLDPEKRQTKVFVMDLDDNYVPIVFNY